MAKDYSVQGTTKVQRYKYINDAIALSALDAPEPSENAINVVADMPFGLPRLLAIHKHIFGDVYDWAGNIRVIPIVKGERVLGGDTVRYSSPDDIERDCGIA